MKRDYYQVLGIGPDADQKEIKKAYRTIIRYCHPDSPDCRMTKDELLEVQEAYETLADPEKRARYDHLKNPPPGPRASRRAATSRSTHFGDPFFEDDIFSDPFSFFRDPFTDSSFLRPAGRGGPADRDLEITLSPDEAFRGGAFEIAIPGPGGIPTGTIVVRIAPGVRSGTQTVVDLSRTIGIRQRVRITIIVAGDAP